MNFHQFRDAWGRPDYGPMDEATLRACVTDDLKRAARAAQTKMWHAALRRAGRAWAWLFVWFGLVMFLLGYLVGSQ